MIVKNSEDVILPTVRGVTFDADVTLGSSSGEHYVTAMREIRRAALYYYHVTLVHVKWGVAPK